MLSTTKLSKKLRGGFSDYKKSRGNRPLFGTLIFINKRKKSNCSSFTKHASPIQKWRFVYKYSVVSYKGRFLIYKVASRVTIEFSIHHNIIYRNILFGFANKLYI